MKHTFTIPVTVVLVFIAGGSPCPGLQGQDRQQSLGRVADEPGRTSYSDPQPTHAAVPYGPHRQNLMDLWIATRADGKPSPVVLFFHGGAFRAGSRFGIAIPDRDLRKPLLAAGISVASVEYRLDPSLRFTAKLADMARSVQWLRRHAADYHIDPERVAAYGSSAGAGAAFWLATHDDMADPDAEDPVLRQSTRLLAVGGINVQATYDVMQLGALLGVPEEVVQKRYGPKVAQMSKAEYEAVRREIRKDYDMLAMLDANDPPMHFENDQNPPENLLGHHPGHAVAIKRKADELGVECVLGNLDDRGQFFIRHLNGER